MTEDPYSHLFDKGNQMWTEVMGSLPPPNAPDGSLDDLARKLIFGELWARPGLSIRDRRLVNLTLLAMLGRDSVTPYHVRAALESGDFDADQLEELSVHLAFYAGWPVATAFVQLVRAEVRRRADAADEGVGSADTVDKGS
jgi:4-carboxymuconolactone decarboxylase